MTRNEALTAWRYLTWSAVVAFAYCASAVAGLTYAIVPGAGTSVWPAAGIAYAALVLGGLRYWPAVLVGRLATAVWVASPTPMWADVAIALATTAGAVGPVWCSQARRAIDPRLGSFRAVAHLTIGGAGAGAAMSATLGCIVLFLAGVPAVQLIVAWQNWTSGFAVGVLAFAPFILSWSDVRAWRRPPGHWLHLAACLAITSAACAFVFLRPETPTIRTWHILPLLVWAALAFQVCGASATLMIVSAFAIAGATLGLGPVASSSMTSVGVMLLTQQFIAVIALTMLFLAAISEERRDVLGRARLAAIVETSPEAILTTDAAGRITSWNIGAELLFGWGEEEAKGRPLIDLIVPADERGGASSILARLKEGEVLRYETRRVARDGACIDVAITASPLRDGSGAFIGISSVMRDIRSRKATERELGRLNAELEARVEARTAELRRAEEALAQSRKLESMGQLTGGVAHDFNNLLTPIIGSLDLLQRRAVGGEKEARLIDGALQAAEKAKTLVQRLLAFARRQPLQTTAVDLVALVSGLEDLIASTTGPAVALSVRVPPWLPPVRGDANQIEMALLNLAVNARDAMPEGGTLTIKAGEDEVDAGDPLSLETGRYVTLAVADTGHGMDEETQERAVEPFFSTKGVGRGTGLGLSSVHGLAAQLGGALALRSAPGAGTTVTMWLPVAADTSVSATRPPPTGVGGGGGRVLLVDDEAAVRTSTAALLEEIGYEVAEAGSAEEALAVIDGGGLPDMVVSDHLMPGMSGSDLARRLASRTPPIPCLIVTGYADVEGIASDLPMLSKPFRRAELARALDELSSAGRASKRDVALLNGV